MSTRAETTHWLIDQSIKRKLICKYFIILFIIFQEKYQSEDLLLSSVLYHCKLYCISLSFCLLVRQNKTIGRRHWETVMTIVHFHFLFFLHKQNGTEQNLLIRKIVRLIDVMKTVLYEDYYTKMTLSKWLCY